MDKLLYYPIAMNFSVVIDGNPAEIQTVYLLNAVAISGLVVACLTLDSRVMGSILTRGVMDF
jgi:hypothetical protein